MSLDESTLTETERLNLPFLDAVAEEAILEENLHFSHLDIEVFRNLLDTHFTDSRLRILDAGCGIGRYAGELADIFSYEGVDISEKILAVAQERCPHLSFSQQTMRKMNFPDGRFHGVWACCSLNTTPKKDVPNIFKEFRRVLKHPGILHLIMPNHGYSDEGANDTDLGVPLYYSSWDVDEFAEVVRASKFTVLGTQLRVGNAFAVTAQKT
jgi:SAM-dependent methyltransferase